MDVPAGGQDFSSTFIPCAVRALIFLARRIQPFLSLVDREVEFCVLTIQLFFSTFWAFNCSSPRSEKNPVCRDRTHVPTCQKVTRLPLSYQGDRLHTVCFVCFLPIYSGRQVCWTYQPGSHRSKVTQDFSSTFFLRCMSYFSREKDSAIPFPRRPWKSNFVYYVTI